MSDELAPGTRLSHYRIVSKIGAGGMGDVYLALDARLDRRVALKLLPARFTQDVERVRRFVQEARATSALNHPYILTVHEIGEADGVHYIAAEFVEGRTLRELISSNEPVALTTLLDIAIQTSEALAAAHDAGIVHRDIKPENVMVRRDGYAKVLDFGLAKLLESAGSDDRTVDLSTHGAIMGTVAYMSPEQARGLPVDARTDIWSFGVLLYELLARRKPFSGDTPTDTIISIVQQEPPALKSLSPEVPDALADVVARALRKRPDERYDGIGELRRDLRRLRQRLDYEALDRGVLPDTTSGPPAVPYATLVESIPLRPSTSTPSRNLTPPNNLSSELSPLIGRASELSEIAGLLQQPEVRLLTLTGVGGTGKTRLAHAVARAVLGAFDDGVYFVELATMDQADLVEQVVAQVLGVQEAHDKSLAESLTDYLRARKLLLVLDNFEQIAQAAPGLGEWLAASEQLTILVTSRVRLHLSFEHEFTLYPLRVPAVRGLTVDELKEYPAVALFVERASKVTPAFALTADNAESIAEICRGLDGLPLAIELAAARVKLLAPRAILKRLENRLKLLTGGARDVPERQRTMRATIKWSYDLLEEEEKTLLNRTSVFRGGFSLESGEAVTNDAADPSVDVFDGCASLVDKSLVVQREQVDGDPRFRMLEVVREFAREKLAESGEAATMLARHAAYFAELSEKAEQGFTGGDTAEWFSSMERELDNLRAALEWALQTDPETALRIVAALPMFWIRRGYLAEGDRWTRKALETSGDGADRPLLARACSAMGSLSWNQGRPDDAVSYFEKSLRLGGEIGDKRLIVRALDGLGIARSMQGDLSTAQSCFEQGYEIAREIDDRYEWARCANCLGENARVEGDYAAARTYYGEALSIARQEAYKHLVQLASINLAAVACLQEDYRAARAYTLETLGIAEELGDRIGVGNALERFAALAVVAGEMERAARLNGALEAVYDAVGYKIEEADRLFLERYLEQARASIGEVAFGRARQEGRAMSLKRAVALALES